MSWSLTRGCRGERGFVAHPWVAIKGKYQLVKKNKHTMKVEVTHNFSLCFLYFLLFFCCRFRCDILLKNFYFVVILWIVICFVMLLLCCCGIVFIMCAWKRTIKRWVTISDVVSLSIERHDMNLTTTLLLEKNVLFLLFCGGFLGEYFSLSLCETFFLCD